MQQPSKGYSSVSQVESDDDNNDPQPKSVTEQLKASSHRRKKKQQQQKQHARQNNLPAMEVSSSDDSSAHDDNNNNNNNNRAHVAPVAAPANNIGNIPNSSRSITKCMNTSWKLCSLFGIEIHIHVLLPLFFIMSGLVWAPLMIKDLGNIGWYLLLLLMFNLSLWETILVHELGHCFAGYLIGGSTDKVLLWPLGGLAFTQPPAQMNNAIGDEKRRKHSIIIALGGPLTHIPHMIVYALLLSWYCDTGAYSWQQNCPFGSDPFAHWTFWEETIIALPDGQGLWFWYDLLMISFLLNFWLFVINLFIPAYPLDGSRIFINCLMRKWNTTDSATIYCWITGIIAVVAIVLGATLFKTQTMLFFTGIWAAFQVYQLSMLLQSSREREHPLFN